MAILLGVLEGSLLAVIYMPLLVIFYKLYFYRFEQYRIKQMAHEIEAVIMESNMASETDMSGDRYFVNRCDYYYKFRRHSYTFKTSEAMDVGKTIKLYFMSNSSKATTYKNVGSNEYIPWIKLYIISYIFSALLCVILNLYSTTLSKNIVTIVILSLVSLFLAYILVGGLFYVGDIKNRLKYGDDIDKHIHSVDAELVHPNKEDMSDKLQVYKYKYKIDGVEKIYKEEARGVQSSKIKLYFLDRPKHFYKDKYTVISTERFRWGRWLVPCWFIITFLICIIFIH